VRGEDDVGQLEDRIAGRDRLLGEDIERGSGQPARPEELDGDGPAQLGVTRPEDVAERLLSEGADGADPTLVDRVARGMDNLMIPLKAALADYVTIGECCAVLRGVFGEYRPGEAA